MKKIRTVFLAAEAVLFAVILAVGWGNLAGAPVLSAVRLAAVLGCTAVAFAWRREDKNYSVLQPWIFVFTAIAGIFLSFFASNTWLAAGYGISLLVQILYHERLWKIRPANLDQKRTQLWIRLGLAMIVVLALRFSGIALDAAVVLAVVTICYLLVNAVQAGMFSGTGREAKLLFLGLLLFLLCELFAGLHLLGNALPGLPAGLVRMAVPLSRTFDLPAQVVLLFGGVREEAG